MGTPARSPAQETRERALNKVFDTLEELELFADRLGLRGGAVQRGREVIAIGHPGDLVAGTTDAARHELQRGAYVNAGQLDKLL
jgi:hypothetical protein